MQWDSRVFKTNTNQEVLLRLEHSSSSSSSSRLRRKMKFPESARHFQRLRRTSLRPVFIISIFILWREESLYSLAPEIFYWMVPGRKWTTASMMQWPDSLRTQRQLAIGNGKWISHFRHSDSDLNTAMTWRKLITWWKNCTSKHNSISLRDSVGPR